MSHYEQKRTYCERVCRFASQQGAELHQDRLPGELFRFAFIGTDGTRHAGGPSKDAQDALLCACKAYADAVL